MHINRRHTFAESPSFPFPYFRFTTPLGFFPQHIPLNILESACPFLNQQFEFADLFHFSGNCQHVLLKRSSEHFLRIGWTFAMGSLLMSPLAPLHPTPCGHSQCPSPAFSASQPRSLSSLPRKATAPTGPPRWRPLHWPLAGAARPRPRREPRCPGAGRPNRWPSRGRGGAGGGARPGRAPRWRVASAPAVPSCPRGARGLLPTPTRSRRLPPAARFVPRLAPSSA